MTMKKTRSHNMTRKKVPHKIDNVRPLKKPENPSSNALDRISELPDDILVSIISLLTLREATTTKILSTRWRHLHPMANVFSLTCPFPLQRQGLYYGYCQLGDEAKFSSYINWVDHTLDSYTDDKIIKKFRVDIPYTLEPNSGTDKLLEFALSREIEIIDIRVYSSFANRYQTYLFSTSIINSGTESLPGLKCVKELSLYGVDLYNSDIGVLLLNLVVLERLLIESSKIEPWFGGDEFYEFDLQIDGPPTSKLKHLIISNVLRQYTYVYNLMNLVSLRFDGMNMHTKINLYNLPKLAHLRVRSARKFILERNFPDIECECVPLQRLEICVGLFKYEILGDKIIILKNEDIFEPPLNPFKMITASKGFIFTRYHLKHLELNVVVDNKGNLHLLFSLIEAFPCLKKLEIKLIWSFKPKYKHRRLDEDRVNRVTTIDYLNTIKLSGFSGTTAELEFVWCVLNNGVVLEELILEGCATNCAIQQREIAHTFKHLISVAPSFVDLILKE